MTRQLNPGCRALRCMPSPGKSGSVFYLSDNDRFMIKSLRGEEVAALLAMLPKYYAHCRASPSTLLTRFLGLHRVKPATGSTVRYWLWIMVQALVLGPFFRKPSKKHAESKFRMDFACGASPSTLLTRFPGLHRVKRADGSTVRSGSDARFCGFSKAC